MPPVVPTIEQSAARMDRANRAVSVTFSQG